MCSSEGITASVTFDRPFSGKIYSFNYGTVHECIYYNALDLDTVLFSIPAHRCGTRLSRTSRNMVDQMENRVYVQMEKDAQTSLDRQFLFVCQLADAKDEKERSNLVSVRRHPVGPTADSPYVVPSGAEAQMPFLTNNALEPVNSVSNSVPRVSAVSSDGHLGNWPIPGSRPYTPNVQPVASWPKIPLPDPIIPTNRAGPGNSATIALSEGGGVRVPDEYPNVPKLAPSTTPRNPFLPPPSPPPTPAPASPIIPARDVPRPATGLYDKQVTVAQRPVEPIEPVKTFFTLKTPIEIVRHTTSAIPMIPALPALPASTPNPRPGTEMIVGVGYVLPESVLARNEIDAGVIGNKVMYRGKATEIPAFPWNRPIPASTEYSPRAQDNVQRAPTAFDKEKKMKNDTQGAKVFIEEHSNVGVDFRTDAGEKVASAESEDSPKSRLISTQEYLAPSPEMSLEIQQGIGPYAPTVTGPVKIGDNITLVVRSKSQMKGEDAYDMFVHSCFASDGPGATKIDLIDRNGCALRPQFVSEMNRTKDPSGTMFYFFRITAFKFPGPDDVYFSCSIEMTPLRNAPEICTSSRRYSRETSPQNDLRLFDSVKVELDEIFETQRRAAELDEEICLSKSLSGIVAILFATLLVAFISSSFLAMSFYLRLSDRAKNTIYAH
ncbi:unnamed protein product [Cylicocyclus nassatus]|uniref:ZP domain-containing protein n=1 Tax=Cylicocyclus nassatus TaxID=53992 RepID=A0AA36GS64_CYLNA|nr:unnamed protein product [Cylicocyclus nassatus]